MRKISFVIISAAVLFVCGCANNIDKQGEKTYVPIKEVVDIENIVDKEAEKKVLIKEQEKEIDMRIIDCYSITEDDSYVYYCSKDGINNEDKSTGRTELIYKDENLCRLYIYEDYLYFLIREEEHLLKVYRVDKYGKDYSIAFDGKDLLTGDAITNLLIKDKTMYIHLNTYQVYSHDMQSKGTKLIVDDAYKFDVTKGCIYWIEKAEKSFTIYRKNFKGGEKEILFGQGISRPESNLCREFVFCGENMYYSTALPGGLYEYSNGKSAIITKSEGIEELLEYKGALYYVVRDTNSQYELMEYRTKDKTTYKVAILKDYEPFRTKIVNGYIYYCNKNYEIQKAVLRKN